MLNNMFSMSGESHLIGHHPFPYTCAHVQRQLEFLSATVKSFVLGMKNFRVNSKKLIPLRNALPGHFCAMCVCCGTPAFGYCVPLDIRHFLI